jgi:signal transduction histidine kinase/DNA-binding NarL/FixJ family response regulator
VLGMGDRGAGAATSDAAATGGAGKGDGGGTPPEAGTRGLLRFFYGLLVLSVVLIALASVYNAGSIGQMRRSIGDVTATLDLQSEISEFLAENQNVETFALRYLLSGREDFLKRYVEATFSLDDRLQRLQQALEGHPQQAALFAELRAGVDARNSRFRDLIAQYQQQGLALAIERVRSGDGAAQLASIRQAAARIAALESRQLAQRQQELEAAIVQSSTTVLLVNGLALIAGLIAFIAIRRSGSAMESGRLAELQAREIERANRERSAFLANISHEIRTPMNAVFGFSQLLARTRIEPHAQEYIKAIQTSGQALLALINDILDLSKIEAGRLSLNPAPTDLRELVDSTLGVFAEAASRKQIGLRAQVAPAVPQTVVVDAHRLRQVLLNLLSNAVKFTDQGEVQLRVRSGALDAERRCTLEIEVHDSGIGIPEDKQAQLFEPFYRAVDDDERSGSGLGLAIVARLLGLMNGRISVRSDAGRGSVFHVQLDGVPATTVSASRFVDREPEFEFADLAPASVLIVDDVAWNRELLGAFLGEAGHRLSYAGNGRDALELVRRDAPDVVLMDLRMPIMDGREATRLLREELGERAPKVIAVTASSMNRDQAVLSSEFDGFIRKPVTRESLYHALLELLGRREPEAPAGEGDGEIEAATALAGGRREEALAALSTVIGHELPGILAALRSREVGALASRLIELGDAGGLDGVHALGVRLRRAVERFDTVSMESLLRQLPEHVAAARDGDG